MCAFCAQIQLSQPAVTSGTSQTTCQGSKFGTNVLCERSRQEAAYLLGATYFFVVTVGIGGEVFHPALIPPAETGPEQERIGL